MGQLSSVALVRAEMKADAYHEPDGTDTPGMGSSLPTATGGGILPALIGSAIDAGVSKVQQSKFENANGHYAEAAKRNIPTGLDKRLTEKLEIGLRKDAFFRTRLRKDGAGKILPTVIRYGYARSSKSDSGEILMSPSMLIEVEIIGADGKSLLKEVVKSDSAQAKPMKTYANDAAFARRAFDVEMDSLVKNLEQALLKKQPK